VAWRSFRPPSSETVSAISPRSWGPRLRLPVKEPHRARTASFALPPCSALAGDLLGREPWPWFDAVADLQVQLGLPHPHSSSSGSLEPSEHLHGYHCALLWMWTSTANRWMEYTKGACGSFCAASKGNTKMA
jgi:hypothetical protein